MPGPAERALRQHRTDIQAALIALFESPVPESDRVGREVLTRVLGSKTIDFNTPIIDIAANPHLSGLTRLGVPPIVWETKERRATNARTVLDPISTAGQEVLLEFLGMSCIYFCSSYLYILVCTSTSFYILIFSFCREFVCG
jgi:hypothetical protein